MGNDSAHAVPSGHPGSLPRDQVTPQLSCELCRERKIKCDKLEPCTNCVSSGAVCVPVHRLRLPRGRHARRPGRALSVCKADPGRPANAVPSVDEDLNKRIQRLEALVDSMGSDIAKPDTVSRGSEMQSSESLESQRLSSIHSDLDTSSATGISTPFETQNSIALSTHHFWADLVEEIHGLRNVMDSALAEADDDIEQAPDPSQTDLVDGGISILGLSGLNNCPAITRQSVGGQVARELCQVYLDQVDPIIKILHRPSLAQWLLQGQGYLSYPEGHASLEALSSAVCYSAATSMTERQCQELFLTDKSCVVADCRRVCEAAIERSGLLATRDITVLQAFVLYLAARKTQDRTRAVSTLVAVAVRIAKALCIHVDPVKAIGRSETFFYQQMRKRLWLTICMMDLQASVFQASETLISAEEAIPSLNLPAHINDYDFDSTTLDVPNREGLTDTTFALVTYHFQLCGRLLNIVGHDKRPISDINSGRPTNVESASALDSADWEARKQHGQRFEQEALSLLHFCDPESSPYAWFTWHGTQCFVAGMRMSALRPFQRSRAGQAPPRYRSGDTEVLHLALQVLEKADLMHTDPRSQPFRWYITIPWPALSIALAESYMCTDVALLRRAWPVIEACYHRHEAVIARFSGGELRGPLGKMMTQTRERVAPLLQGSSDTINSLSSSHAKSPAYVSLKSSMRPETFAGEGASGLSSTGIQSSSGLSEEMWDIAPLSLENQSVLDTGLSYIDPSLQQEISDESWRMWEEFVTGISFDEFANAGMLFDESYMGG